MAQYTDKQIDLAHKIMDDLSSDQAGRDAIQALKYALMQTEEAEKNYQRAMRGAR
ncbi:MAG: hypothetical protein GY749_22925 [Desulfobacteraceae bacterium]|nr:hypothetical protein [Desulfobacteraceae bacterium]